MKFQLLFLIFIIVPVFALHVGNGCIAKSNWKKPYIWNDVKLGAWTPPGDETKIMTIVVEFEDQVFPITYDVIELYRNKIIFDKVREGVHSTSERSLSFIIEGGWSTFAFNVDKYYGMKYLSMNARLPLNASVEFKPESLEIEGSNITVNCHSDPRTWKISKKPSVLPLENSMQYWFSFYSSQNFLPTIQLEMRNYQLRWDRGALITIPTMGQSLPPFVEHHLTLTCRRDNNVLCTLSVGMERKLVEEIRIGEFPKSVVIFGKDDVPFFVMLHENDQFSSQEIEIVAREISSSVSQKDTYYIILPVLIVLACACMTFWKRDTIKLCLRKKTESKNADLESNEMNGSKTNGLRKSSNCSISSDSGISAESCLMNENG